LPLIELEINSTSAFAEGETFGEVGSYKYVEGIAHFAVDPNNARNQAITDIELAPRDSHGRVRFSSNFALLQPEDPTKGNHSLLFDVCNRGRKTSLGFNGVPTASDPLTPLQAGSGFLMRRGYTLVWCGWQADVPPTPGLIGMQAPEAMDADGHLTGSIMCQLQGDSPTNVFLLAHRNHLPHSPIDMDDPSAVLTVRDHPNSPATTIDRGQWSFVRVEDSQQEPNPNHIYMPSGFQPGKMYQVVYRTAGSWIVGLGFAAVRDTVSFLKHAPTEAGNPCAEYIQRAHGFGRSQSGRFLREMIYLGLNEDEEERIALDGIMPLVGGGMRGEFNLRFGQPSQDICFTIPELFPFTDTDQTDPVTGNNGALLARAEARNQAPKIMFINTSAEYWRGDAALIHTDLETMTDAPESDNVRRYHYAGCQHGPGDFPPLEIRPDGLKGQLPFNSVDYGPLLRASLESLDRWVATGEAPPDSRHPSLNDGTAVESCTLLEAFSKVPSVKVPTQNTRAIRLDYGPESHLGRSITLPAIEGAEYPALVSNINEDCNEVGGIRLPDLTVPVATYTGWNLRHDDIGNPDLFIGVSGGLAGWTLPFPTDAKARGEAGDPRLSIAERYADRDDYLARTRQAAEALVNEGYMLAEDIEPVVERAGTRYDYFTASART